MRLDTIRRRAGHLGLLAGLTLAVTACPDEAIDITESATGGVNVLNFTVTPALEAPVGTFVIDNISATTGRPDSLTVTFNDLEALSAGAVYEAWLLDGATGTALLATGTYEEIEVVVTLRDEITGEILETEDVVRQTVADASSFVGGNAGEAGFRHRLTLSDNTLTGGATLGEQTHVLLTIASAPGGSAPADSRPIWAQYIDLAGTPGDPSDDVFFTTGTTLFGTFALMDPTASVVYGVNGGGFGGVLDDQLSVDLESVPLPPVGYRYVGWVFPAEGSPVMLADLTGPPPARQSLVEADREPIPGVTNATGIVEANVRAFADELGIRFGDFTTFVLALEPKTGAPGFGSIPTHAGPLPEELGRRLEPEGDDSGS